MYFYEHYTVTASFTDFFTVSFWAAVKNVVPPHKNCNDATGIKQTYKLLFKIYRFWYTLCVIKIVYASSKAIGFKYYMTQFVFMIIILDQ